jgi:diguanylate cyclase (GGDEF)-like protein/PAS domain S-box-containing protein
VRLIFEVPDAQDPASGPPSSRVDAHAFEQLFTHAGGLLAILDMEARFVAVNPACERVLGFSPAQLVGRTLLDDLAPDDAAQARVRHELEQDGYVELLARHRHRDGGWRWLLWSGAAQDGRWYASAKDVTDSIRLEERIGRDALTTLPTREVFNEELGHALARHARSRRYLAVLVVDIDAFKQVNDSIGHEAGDRLLVNAAERLRKAVRAGDTVARFGGDEFAILVELLDSDHEAVTIARSVVAAFDEPFELGGDPVAVSASVGLAIAHDASRGAHIVIHEADIAMHRAKASTRGGFAIFDAGLRSEVERRLTLERALRTAVADGQFEVHYQPIVSTLDGTVVSCEALVRWTHPQWGPIAPDEFIPLAEENGLIVPLGAWILETALHQLARWRASGAELGISVNVSPRQVANDSLVATVTSLLDDTGVPPAALCLEITETAVLAEPIRAATRLAQLRALGVRVAFDDFGTGYSSLRHLSQLPVDVIKLDRTFVTALSRDEAHRSRAVLMAVVSAAEELGIGVIAEGVEDPTQFAELQRAGCGWAQGYMFSGAVPAEQVRLSGYELAPRLRRVPNIAPSRGARERLRTAPR